MYFEEKLLAGRSPEYVQYAATTWRMIPFMS
jgi:protein-S-isoprenylcysteine O-methyltransferase Ste14